jgi:hypothetical protein
MVNRYRARSTVEPRFGSKGARLALKKFQKIDKKKLASSCPLTLDGKFERQTARLAVQKKFKKSEKKACQAFRNLITLPKPNQTNGETNDTKRTKNV